jgi:acyl-CoA reductase-like NAD-dependent aldehyde dehydrogenase
VFGERPGENAFSDLIDDAFSGAGQDCKSVSILFLPETEKKTMVERIHDLARAFPVGDPRDGAWMGPMQDPARLDRYLKFIGISEREGATVVMRGKPLPGAGKSWCVTPTLALYGALSTDELKKSVALQTEILAPLLSVVSYRDSEHLVSLLGALNHAHTCTLRGVGLPDPGSIPFSRVLRDQSVLDADPTVSVHYRKRNGNHALMGLESPRQLMRRTLK